MNRREVFFALIISMLFSNLIFSQSQIINKDTKATQNFKLKITKVKKDSITFRYAGGKSTIPLTSIIAYRKSKRDVFIFPDRVDKKNYAIIGDSAIRWENLHGRVPEKISKEEYMNKILMNPELTKLPFSLKVLQQKNTILLTDSVHLVKANSKRKVYLILKTDQRKTKFYGKIVETVKDSIIYFTTKSNERTHLYAIDKKNIQYIGLEPKKAFATRMAIGVGLCIVTPFVPFGVTILLHPDVTVYDLEHKWKFKLVGKNKLP